MADTAEFSFEHKEWESFLNKLDKKLTDIKSKKEFAGIISSTVFGDIMDHFDKEQGPDGSWTPWSKSYLTAIHGKNPPRQMGKILQASRNLAKAVMPKSRNYRVNQGVVTFFNNAKTKSGFPYAFAHDNDTEPRSKLPRRAFMWLSDNGMEKIITLTETWLAE